jgi:hypothetical protein
LQEWSLATDDGRPTNSKNKKMAVNFQLICKSTNEPVKLSSIDDEICRKVYNVEPHERFYGGNIFNWYDTIGFMIATGMSLEDGDNSVRKHYENSELWQEELPIINQVIDYLQDKYTSKSWISIGK